MDWKRAAVGLVAFAAAAAAVFRALTSPLGSEVGPRFALWAICFAALALYAFVYGGRLRVVAAILVAVTIPFPLLLAAGAFEMYSTWQGDLVWPAVSGAGLVLVALGRRAPPLGAWVAVAAQAAAVAVGILLLVNASAFSPQVYVQIFAGIDSLLAAGCLGLALLPSHGKDAT